MSELARRLREATERLRGHNDAIAGLDAVTVAGPYGKGYQKGLDARGGR
jgi:hypothetical protein